MTKPATPVKDTIDRAAIRALRLKEYPIDGITVMVGHGYATVCVALYGVPNQQLIDWDQLQRADPELCAFEHAYRARYDRVQIIAGYLGGLSYSDLKRKFGCDSGTVLRALYGTTEHAKIDWEAVDPQVAHYDYLKLLERVQRLEEELAQRRGVLGRRGLL